MLCIASMTSRNRGSSRKCAHSCWSSCDSLAIVKRSFISPDCTSGSGLTVQALPSSSVCSMLSHCRLSLSATTLRHPGTCRTATMLCAIIPSLHRACVTDMVSFANTSLSTWQSVSISTGKPQMVSEKWSGPNFRAVNSSKNGL